MDRRHSRTVPLRPLVLLVDGNAETLAPFALAVAATGFEVVAATNGAEAFTRVWQTHPDIIVTELPMPAYDGWQFLQDLKASPHTRDIPVVALSDRIQESIREQPNSSGFAAFLPTECPPSELAEQLRQILGGKAHAIGSH